jgi:DNA-binding MarR family transcriptional regulator
MKSLKEKRSDLSFETWNALMGATWPIFTHIATLTLQVGSSSAQISLLNVLVDSTEDMTPLAVANKLKVTPGTVTGTLDRLERTRLILRIYGTVKDRRVVKLRITPKGRDLVNHWRQLCRDRFDTAMTPLSDQELYSLILLLTKLSPPLRGVPEGLPSLLKSKMNPPEKRVAK